MSTEPASPVSPAPAPPAPPTEPGLPRPRPMRIARWRPWVQSAFLAVWLAPWTLLGSTARFMSVPGCVFHCYACPLAATACPVGLAAGFAALHLVPLLVLGVLVAVGGLVGSLVCGWACPFGFLQDLLAKVPIRKVRLPAWTGYGRYAVLVGLVVLVPWFWGEEHPLFICRVCPAGAMEAGLPFMAQQAAGGGAVVGMSALKWAVLGGFLLAAIVTLRPWCTVLCPLGGALALFNRYSVFHLRFARAGCTECNLCRSRCSCGVQVEQRVNTSRCIRCMECTTCGAIRPALGRREG